MLTCNLEILYINSLEKIKVMKYQILIFTTVILGTVQHLAAQLSFADTASTVLENSITHGVITNVGLGPGISFVDYNGDGWDDISIPASSSEDFQFLKNEGGSFVLDVLPITSNGNQARQISWVDFDNDGDLDFFATGEQGDFWFYENEGAGVYTNITAQSGLIPEAIEYWGNSWGDYDNDGLLDVFISVRDNAQIDHNRLYRNNGDGTFTDVTQESLLETTGYITFCSAFFDYDRDGDQDIYTANDKDVTPNKLYRNNGDGTFTDVSIESGTDLYMSAMSTTIDDYDNDGWMDIYVTNFYPPFEEDVTLGNALLHNNGDGTFTNVGLESNTRFDSIGWGAVFLDADGDMDKDLYVSGALDGTNDFLASAFYENEDLMSFELREDIGFGENAFISMGNAIGDIDNDGLPDIVVVNVANQPINIWRNKTEAANNWIKINLEGVVSNRMGIGAQIEVKTDDIFQYGYTLCGEGYASQNSSNEFFGLGENTSITHIKVTWPSGGEDFIENVEANQTITIKEGEGILSIEEATKLAPFFKAYPVPTRDYLQIDYSVSELSVLNIYGVLGSIIHTQNLDPSLRNTTVDCSDLPSGIYILEMVSSNEVRTQKMILR